MSGTSGGMPGDLGGAGRGAEVRRSRISCLDFPRVGRGWISLVFHLSKQKHESETMSERNRKALLISVVLIPWISAFFDSGLAFLLRIMVDFFRPSKISRWLFAILLLVSAGIYYGYSNSWFTISFFSVLFIHWMYLDIKLMAKLMWKTRDSTMAAPE